MFIEDPMNIFKSLNEERKRNIFYVGLENLVLFRNTNIKDVEGQDKKNYNKKKVQVM